MTKRCAIGSGLMRTGHHESGDEIRLCIQAGTIEDQISFSHRQELGSDTF